MSDIDLESNAGEQDTYEDDAEKFDNLIGDAPVPAAKPRGMFEDDGNGDEKSEVEAALGGENVYGDEVEEDDEQPLDDHDQSQDIRSYMNKYKNIREEEGNK